jgi:regulator of RNase E activity RraA
MSERPTGYLSTNAEQALLQVSTATLTTMLLRRGFRTTFLVGIAPLRPDLRMVGYAYTLRYIPMREDLTLGNVDNTRNEQRLAIEDVGSGDVLVMDARGDLDAGTIGDILATRLLVRGAAGVVTDGAIRDTPAFLSIDLPAYCAGAHAAPSPVRHYPADRNLPIGCAGVLVMPGDVVVGDAEGVVVIPRHVAEEVALAAWEYEQLETFALEKVRSGASIVGTYPPSEATKAEFERSRRPVS